MTNFPSDSTLLARFVDFREEEAFAELMRRHEGRVRAACRRVLASEHDVDDAVQATFVVLARRAGEVPWNGSVGGWLCAVAQRLSLHARAGRLRRQRRETTVAALAPAGFSGRFDRFPEEYHPRIDPLAEIARRDLRKVLDAALDGLPEKYRSPVVLCDLEGLTHEEAAERLGWPAGSMSRRLGRARALLRERLSGSSLSVAIGLLLAVLLGWKTWTEDVRDPKSRLVADAMAQLSRPGTSGHDIQPLLARLEQPGRSRDDREEVVTLARLAAESAARIETTEPSHDRRLWRSYTEMMRGSALGLARASREGDDPALVAAARRLNESCVRCHLAFRQ